MRASRAPGEVFSEQSPERIGFRNQGDGYLDREVQGPVPGRTLWESRIGVR
jgi:hypothetical protein